MNGNGFGEEALLKGSRATLVAAACIPVLLLGAADTARVWAASGSAAGSNACGPAGTTACRIMPATGPVTLPIPGTPASLVGVGTPDRAGKQIVISRVPLVCSSLGGIGIKIITPRSAGLLPPLHWSNGTLYARNPTSGHCVGIASPALAAAPGVYQVVPTLARMPATGGAASGPDPRPWTLLLSALLVLLGAAARTLVRRLPRP